MLAVAGKTLFVAAPRAWWAPRGIARARGRSGDPIGTSKTKGHPRDPSPVPGRPPAGARAPCAHPKKNIYIYIYIYIFEKADFFNSKLLYLLKLVLIIDLSIDHS